MIGANILKMHRLRKVGHPDCLACTHPDLKLNFTMDGPHRVRTSLDFTKSMTSFNGMIHGGLLALVIDEAMTCALMAEGHYAATGDLKLRYLHPVRSGPTAHIIVTVKSRFKQLFKLSAELKQEGVLCTQAEARFMKQELNQRIAL